MRLDAALKVRCPPEARPLDTPTLLCCIRKICRESDVGFEPTMTMDEDRSAFDCAWGFLHECDQCGADPLQLVQALA